MNILVLNPGSSSLKFAVYEMPGETVRLHGSISSLNDDDAVLKIKTPGNVAPISLPKIDLADAVAKVLEEAHKPEIADKIDAIACRVVHGGDRFHAATIVDKDVLQGIDDLKKLAPLHNPASVTAIEAARKTMPNTPIVAVFDTSFHQSIPKSAHTYALPQDIPDHNSLHRYGFHGISYRYIAEKFAEEQSDISNTIICHLGNGASICALKDGKSVDTSMGLTPLEGLIMGTRSGDLDPGLLVYLMREGMDADTIENLLNKKSGLLGISGISGDLRALDKASESGNQNATDALEAFAYRAAKYIASYTVALNGFDALIFTAGIGENSSTMRQRICNRLAHFDTRLDETINRETTNGKANRISTSDSKVAVYVLPTDEELQMARELLDLLSKP